MHSTPQPIMSRKMTTCESRYWDNRRRFSKKNTIDCKLSVVGNQGHRQGFGKGGGGGGGGQTNVEAAAGNVITRMSGCLGKK